MPEIDKNEFPPNSINRPKILSTEGGKPVEKLPPGEPVKNKKVITGTISRKKKGFLDRFSETFFGDDAKSVGSYVLWDVLIPAAKNTITDMVSTGIEMLLFGEGRSSNIRRERGRSHVPYNSIYSRGEERRSERRLQSSRRAQFNFDDIVIPTRKEAEDVLEQLLDVIEEYEVVTVADFYEAVGEPGEYTDRNYGWNNLTRAYVEQVRGGGYVLVLPRPYPLDK